MRKKESRGALHRSVILKIVIAGAIIALSVIYIQVLNNKIQEKGFIETKIALLKLQDTFNRADSGWKYSDSCRAKGGVYEADVPSSCAMSINNNQIALNRSNSWDKIKEYKRIVENDSQFKILEVTEKNEENAVIYKISELPKGYCTLETVQSEKNEELYKISFVCRQTANKFYFPRNDT